MQHKFNSTILHLRSLDTCQNDDYRMCMNLHVHYCQVIAVHYCQVIAVHYCQVIAIHYCQVMGIQSLWSVAIVFHDVKGCAMHAAKWLKGSAASTEVCNMGTCTSLPYSLNISRGKIFADFVDFLRPAKILFSKYLVWHYLHAKFSSVVQSVNILSQTILFKGNMGSTSKILSH